MRSTISETNMVQCPHCIGRGFIRSNESMSIQMIRSLEKEASAGTWSSLRLSRRKHVALHLLNTKREVLRVIEERHNVTIQVLVGAIRTRQRRKARPPKHSQIYVLLGLSLWETSNLLREHGNRDVK